LLEHANKLKIGEFKMATKKSGKKTGNKKSGKAKTSKRVAKKSVKKAAKSVKKSVKKTAKSVNRAVKKVVKKAATKKRTAKKGSSRKTRVISITIPQLSRSKRGQATPEKVATQLIEKAQEIVNEVLETARGAAVSVVGEKAVATVENIGTAAKRNAESVLPRPAKVRHTR
jgi:hypothetical protein